MQSMRNYLWNKRGGSNPTGATKSFFDFRSDHVASVNVESIVDEQVKHFTQKGFRTGQDVSLEGITDVISDSVPHLSGLIDVILENADPTMAYAQPVGQNWSKEGLRRDTLYRNLVLLLDPANDVGGEAPLGGGFGQYQAEIFGEVGPRQGGRYGFHREPKDLWPTEGDFARSDKRRVGAQYVADNAELARQVYGAATEEQKVFMRNMYKLLNSRVGERLVDPKAKSSPLVKLTEDITGIPASAVDTSDLNERFTGYPSEEELTRDVAQIDTLIAELERETTTGDRYDDTTGQYIGKTEKDAHRANLDSQRSKLTAKLERLPSHSVAVGNVIVPLSNAFLVPVETDGTRNEALWNADVTVLAQNAYTQMLGVTDPSIATEEHGKAVGAGLSGAMEVAKQGQDAIHQWQLAMQWGAENSSKVANVAGVPTSQYHGDTGKASITNWSNGVVEMARELLTRREVNDMEHDDFVSNPAYEQYVPYLPKEEVWNKWSDERQALQLALIMINSTGPIE